MEKKIKKEKKLTLLNRKRKSIEITCTSLNIQTQWHNLDTDIKHYVRLATAFFTRYPCSEFIQKLRSQLTTKHKIAFVKVVYHFVTVYSRQQLKSYSVIFSEKDRSVFTCCAFMTDILSKKILDPNQKDNKKVKWPCLDLSLSLNEVLFYWFILQFEIAIYVQDNEEKIEAAYIQHKQTKGSGLTKNFKFATVSSPALKVIN